MKGQDFSKDEIAEIEAFVSEFSPSILVKVHVAHEGGFCATIESLEGITTEAETFSELIEMINDAVYTYFEVPRKYLRYMPTYIPSVALAKKFGIIPPSLTITDRGKFSLANA